MAHPTAVINVVGLNRSLIGEWSLRLSQFAQTGMIRTIQPVLPAVTCSVQSSMLTGLSPAQHGIVGNGWYDRDLAEVQFWKQSNRLVCGEKVWETARRRDPSITCANLFWWFNMYSSADFSVTPRPIYKADGRKIPDVYTQPADLRDELQRQFGTFPLFHFWGPGSSIRSSQWIADAAMFTYERHHPALTLIYLPHLDYCLQRHGPHDQNVRAEVAQIDQIIGRLIDFFSAAGVRVIMLSEYGIEEVDDAVHINRVLREAGAVCVREEQGLELLDPSASEAFAVADHQVAHVYVSDPARIQYFADLCRGIPGVEQVLDRTAQARHGLDHARGGDLVLVADARRWFSYYYWLDDHRAPDFARTVDIHRKPGYDPVELFFDPAIAFPRLSTAWKLLRRKLGFRTLLDVIPLDASLVRGSHGRIEQPENVRPIVVTQHDRSRAPETIACTQVRDVILDHLFAG